MKKYLIVREIVIDVIFNLLNGDSSGCLIVGGLLTLIVLFLLELFLTFDVLDVLADLFCGQSDDLGTWFDKCDLDVLGSCLDDF